MWESILGAANKFLQGIGLEQKPNPVVNTAQQMIQSPQAQQSPLVASPNTYSAIQAYQKTHPGYTPPNGYVTENGQPLTNDQALAMMTQPNAVNQQQGQPQQQSPQPQAPQQQLIQSPTLPQSTYQQAQNGGFGRIPQTNSMKIDPSVTNAITGASNQFGVPKNLLYDIGFSESSLDPTKQPNELNHAGLFQFDPALWNQVLQYSKQPGNSVVIPNPNKGYMDPANAAYGAAYLISHGQLGRWDASDWNWGQHYTPQELEKQGFYSQDTTHTPGKFYYQLNKK